MVQYSIWRKRLRGCPQQNTLWHAPYCDTPPPRPIQSTNWTVPRLSSQSEAFLAQTRKESGAWCCERVVFSKEEVSVGHFSRWAAATCRFTVMAQQNLSVVLHSAGDLRLVGRHAARKMCIRLCICSPLKWHMLLHFMFTQENRPIPEPGPNGMSFRFETCII